MLYKGLFVLLPNQLRFMLKNSFIFAKFTLTNPSSLGIKDL